MKSSNSASAPLSLYIHIPFCKTICLYCAFATFANKAKRIPEYVDAVIAEMEATACGLREKNRCKKVRIEAIYFGGGTPSLIDPELIKKLIQHAKKLFTVSSRAEVSMECNPESVSDERVRSWEVAGVNRFSLGVQSFDARTLKRVARPHGRAEIMHALNAFKTCGIKNFGTDFIIGLPYQTIDSFKEEIELILSYHPAHLSYYFLSYDTKKIDLFAKDCPDEEEQIVMYEWLCKRLKRAGFSHYEVSNWALRGYECVHNKRYWEQKDYLGVGVGAHSIIDGVMRENTRDFDAYLRDSVGSCEETSMDDEMRRMESIMLGLRTKKGLDTRTYEKRYGKKALDNLMQRAKTFITSGHLCKRGSRLSPTENGYLMSDRIVRDLI